MSAGAAVWMDGGVITDARVGLAAVGPNTTGIPAISDALRGNAPSQELYERAGAPKKLICQTDTTHYASFRDNYDVLMREFAAWLDRWLRYSPISSREQRPTEEILYV